MNQLMVLHPVLLDCAEHKYSAYRNLGTYNISDHHNNHYSRLRTRNKVVSLIDNFAGGLFRGGRHGDQSRVAQVLNV